MTLPASIDRFFFRKVSGAGFGLMRIAWGLVVFGFGVLQWNDVWRYFSNQGILPPEIAGSVLRSIFRFTIFDYIQNPAPVFLLYLLLLIFALLSAAGVRARWTTLACTVLLFSFHERNYLPLAGGETVLRLLGFLLVIAPDISAFSVDRLRQQWKHWRLMHESNGILSLLPAPRMSIWPYRLLLWQLLVLYITSGWDKLTGSMWWTTGTAVGSALHHPNFLRVPLWISDWVSVLSLPLSRLTVIFEFSWLLLLIPSWIMVQKLGFKPGGTKRALIVAGILFHGGILLLMHVGSFPYAFFAAYLGLLLDEDFDALRARCNKRFWGQRVYIMFDGACRLCQRSIFTVMLLDWLKRTEPVNFRKEEERLKVASDIPFEELDKSMHVRFAKTARNPILGNQTLKGFDGFRKLSWHLPALWIVAPLLYLPGAGTIGRKVYERIAERRHKCDGPSCTL